MESVIISIHLISVIALVVVILLQRSEGGALGIGGGSGNLFSVRGAGNVLTRATAILALVFFITSISLTIIATRGDNSGSISDKIIDSTSGTRQPATQNQTDTDAPDTDAPDTNTPDTDEPGIPQLDQAIPDQTAPEPAKDSQAPPAKDSQAPPAAAKPSSDNAPAKSLKTDATNGDQVNSNKDNVNENGLRGTIQPPKEK